MKSENQIIVQCKQPMKIEKQLQCLPLFSYGVDERNILQTVFFSFYFLNALQNDNNSNKVYVLRYRYKRAAGLKENKKLQAFRRLQCK